MSPGPAAGVNSRGPGLARPAIAQRASTTVTSSRPMRSGARSIMAPSPTSPPAPSPRDRGSSDEDKLSARFRQFFAGFSPGPRHAGAMRGVIASDAAARPNGPGASARSFPDAPAAQLACSGSMRERTRDGQTKIDVARRVVADLIKDIPDGMQLTGTTTSGGRVTGAGRTSAIEQQVVAADRETRRSQFVQPCRATGHLEDPPTAAAVEMMMVSRGRVAALVPRRLTGDGHRHREAFVEQGAQGPVDGRHAQTGCMKAGRVQHLRRTERSARLPDRTADGLSLLRIPDHPRATLKDFPDRALDTPLLDNDNPLSRRASTGAGMSHSKPSRRGWETLAFNPSKGTDRTHGAPRPPQPPDRPGDRPERYGHAARTRPSRPSGVWASHGRDPDGAPGG
jgi:hypothetical protein